MFSQNILQKRYNIDEMKMPSRLKMGAAHFRTAGTAPLQFGINPCPRQGCELLSPGDLAAMAGQLGDR